MPAKSLRQRALKAKRQGSTMILKESDIGGYGGRSSHAAKKSHSVVAQYKFSDRAVSPRSTPGRGITARSIKLPLPETGSSTSRRRTHPPEASGLYRKSAPRSHPRLSGNTSRGR